MINFNIKQLIQKGVHLGHYKWECDYKISYYLLGLRNFLHILNINYTIYILKRILYLVYYISKLNQKILLINNNFYNNLINKFYNYDKNFCLLNYKWKGGLLTNQKNIRKYNIKLLKNYKNLKKMELLPSFIFISNINKNLVSVYESILLNIPTSALINSNLNLYGIHYPIPANNESIITINFFNLLLIKSCLESINKNIISIYQHKIIKII